MLKNLRGSIDADPIKKPSTLFKFAIDLAFFSLTLPPYNKNILQLINAYFFIPPPWPARRRGREGDDQS